MSVKPVPRALPAWCREVPGGWHIDVHAQPGAKRSDIAGLHGARLKVRVADRAVDGRANRALEGYLAECLGVPRSAVRVVRGERSRDKIVGVAAAGVDPLRLLALA